MLKTRLSALVLCLSLLLSVTADAAAVQPEPAPPPEPYVQGTGDGRFLPYRPLTHQEAAIMVSNLFGGDGLPVSEKENHGYGCYSIRAIAERHHGLCDFETKNDIFTLRVVLPLSE